MTRRVLSLLIAVILVLVTSPSTQVHAARMQNPNNRIEGIDYTRIKQNEMLALPVIFGFGDVNFNQAKLVNGNTLTDEEIDKIIRRVMESFKATASDGSDMPMTSGRLNYYEDVIQRSRGIQGKWVKGFDAASLIRLAGIALGFDVRESYASVLGSFLGGKLVDKLAGLYAPAEFVWDLVSLSENPGMVQEISGELFRMYCDNELAKEAVIYTALLETFYATCNHEILKVEMEKAEPSWKIKCNQTVWRDTTVFGVKATQYWRLTCELTNDFDYGSGQNAEWSGRYRGWMQLQIWHDLSQLDEQFKDSVFLSPTLPFRNEEQVFVFGDSTGPASKLVKTLNNPEVELHLDRRNGTSGGLVQYFPLKGFEDTSEFHLARQIIGTPNLAMFDGDTAFLDFGVATYTAEVDYRHNFAGGMTGDNKGVVLDFSSWEENVQGLAEAFGYSRHENFSSTENPGVTIMTDYTPFAQLRHGGVIEIAYNVE